MTKHETLRDDAQRLERFKRYILDNYKSWETFATDHDHGISVEDIILVTGRDITEDFAMIAFSHQEQHLNMSFEISASQIASTSASAWGSWKCEFPVFKNWGPQGTKRRVRAELMPTAEDRILGEPQFKQCVFLRGYRLKFRMRIITKVIRAGAGPHDLGFDGGDQQDVPTLQSSEDEMEAVLESPKVTDTYTSPSDIDSSVLVPRSIATTRRIYFQGWRSSLNCNHFC